MIPYAEQAPLLKVNGKGDCRVAGVVVLYHPGKEVAANISSYLGDVEVLFAIDNTEGGSGLAVERLRELGNVLLIANGRNLGVARALNMGVELALERGVDFLLTMDQDSRANPGMVKSLLSALASFDSGTIGIVAPKLVTKPDEKADAVEGCRKMTYAMTSGSLLDLRAYEKAGPFLDELFVDFVDIEYSLRLRACGYRIIRANRAVLEHRVGDLMMVPMIGGELYLTSHSPLRKYYKTRNRFFVAKRYRSIFPAFCLRDRIRFFLEMIRLLLFESEKREKLKMMLKGYGDYSRGRLGRYDTGEGESR